jgi:hypothetical protein
MSTRPWIPDDTYDAGHGLLADMRLRGCKVRVEGTGLIITYPGKEAYRHFAAEVHAYRKVLVSVLAVQAIQARQRKESHVKHGRFDRHAA